MDYREAIAKFKKKLEALEHQIYEPTELINLILPLIAEILRALIQKISNWPWNGLQK